MQHSEAEIVWKWNAMGATPSEDYEYKPQPVEVPTGANWCGTHGMVMELMRVEFDYDFQAVNNYADVCAVSPYGYQINNFEDVAQAGYEQANFDYRFALALGGLGRKNTTKREWVEGKDIAIAWQKNEALLAPHGADQVPVPISLTHLENKMTWDLSDGKGNGMLIAAPALTYYGACFFTQTNVSPAGSLLRFFLAPWGKFGETQPPTSSVRLLYKYRKVNMQQWVALTQNQAQNDVKQ